MRLSDAALLALASLMVKMEGVGHWAEELDLVLIVLLDKARQTVDEDPLGSSLLWCGWG